MRRIGGWHGLRRRLAVTAASVVLGGCSLPFGQPALAGLTCLGVPDDTCRQHAVALGLGTDPSVVAVQLECTSPACTPGSGEVRVRVRRADGSVEESGFGWQAAEPAAVPVPLPAAEPPDPAGVVAPDVTPVCLGVPDPACFEQFEALLHGSIPAGRILVQATIRCAGRCDDRAGEGETVGVLDDGSTVTQTWGYQSPGAS